MDEGGRAQLDRMTKGSDVSAHPAACAKRCSGFLRRQSSGGAQCRGRRTGRFALRPIRKNGRSAADIGIGRAVLEGVDKVAP